MRGCDAGYRGIQGDEAICNALNAPLWNMGCRPYYRGAVGRIVGQLPGRWSIRAQPLRFCGTAYAQFACAAFSRCAPEEFLTDQRHFLLLYKDIFSAGALESPPRGTSAH